MVRKVLSPHLRSLQLDYGESSYIGPIEGEQPNSEAWTNGFPHLGFLDMTSYYATAYKTGAYPTVTEDKVYIWSRPHPRDAQAQDYVGRPNNADWVRLLAWRDCEVLTHSSRPRTTSGDLLLPQALASSSLAVGPMPRRSQSLQA